MPPSIKPHLSEIHVADEFAEVFKDVPRCQEIEFTIGLVGSTIPIFRALYQMRLVELAKLKV